MPFDGWHERGAFVKKRVFTASDPQAVERYSVWSVLFGGVMGFTLLLLFFVDKNSSFHIAPNSLPISNAQLAIVPVILLFSFLFFLAQSPAQQQSPSHFYKQISCYFVFVLLCQMIIASNIWFDTGWDVNAIRLAAKDMVSSGIESAIKKHAWYYSRYPNNIFLMLFTAFLTKIGTYLWPSYSYRLVTLTNIVFVWLSVYAASLCTYRITQSRRITAFAALLGTFLICFSGFMVIPYSDTMAMPFPIFSIVCVLFCKNKSIKTALVTFLSTLGSLFKPTVLIVLFAYCILCLFDWIRLWLHRQKIAHEALVTVGIIALIFCSVTSSYTLFKKHLGMNAYFRADSAMTPTHFLMMGANSSTDGTYSEEDVTFSCNFPDIKSRERENLREYARRIQALGVSGTLSLLVRKHIITYNNGMFSWGGEGGFYQTANDRTDPLAVFLQELYYGNLNDPKYTFLSVVQQILWLTLLLGLSGLIFYKSPTSYAVSLLSLTLLGVTLYLLLFECRSRYLFVFMPLFICLLGAGVQGWFRVQCSLSGRLQKLRSS